MKRYVSVYFSLAVLLAAVASSPAQVPEAVRQLNEQYRIRLDEACAPVNQWYLAELLTLYTDCRSQDRKSDAKAIASLIHSIAPDTVLPQHTMIIPPTTPASEHELLPLPPATSAEALPAGTPEPTPMPTNVPIEPLTPAPAPKLTELDRVKIILPDVAVLPAQMSYELPASGARLEGDVQFNGKDISLWRGLDSSVSWVFTNTKAGLYDISLLYSTDIAAPGAFEVRIGNETLERPTIDRTGARHKYRKCSIGRLSIPAGDTIVTLIKKQRGGLLFNLKMLYLDEVNP